MANASIFSQYVKPVRSMQDYANDYDVAEQNKLALAAKRMEMQRAEAGMQDQQRIRGLASQYGSDENALIKALRGGGYFDQAGGLEKQIAERLKGQGERDKTAAEIDEKRFKLAKERRDAYEAARGGFERDPQLSKDKVVRVLSEMGDIGVLPAELVQKLTANLPDDPEALRADIRTGNLSRLTPEQMVTLFTPKYEFQDSGQQRIPVQMNMNVPGAVAPQTIQKVATPGEVLTDTRTRAEGALNRGVTIRGQNLTDARSRDATAATLTKPFEVTGPDGTPMLVQQDKQGNIRPVQGYGPKAGTEKPLNDTQSKALLFGSRMREAGKVLDELEKSGTTTSVPGSRSGYGIGSVVTALSSSQKQQLDQAKRDFVNAVLRRESGAVIADSEFDNADKQYFPQIGDSPKVIAQKRRNRELATNGILQEVPENRRNGLQPQAQMPTADDIRKQADNILKGG